MGRWTVGMGFLVLVACGSEAPESTSVAAPSEGAIGSCDVPTLSTCTHYGAGTPEVRALAESSCAQQHGHFASGECPTASVVATCAASAAGDVTYYYGSGGTPYTAESGQAACTASAAPAHATTTVAAPAADAPTLQEWCDTPSAWICEHRHADRPRDACVAEESATCLAVGYPASTRLSRPRAALDRCMTDLQAATSGRPSSCRPPPVAPGSSMVLTQWCPEVAAERCRCEPDLDACIAARCPAEPAWYGDVTTPVGSLGDLERCLDLARSSACDAPAAEGCHAGWSDGSGWTSDSVRGLRGS